MIWLESRHHRSQLQQQLDRDAAVATMEVVSGEEAIELSHAEALAFGPYNVSPIRGLHFDNAEDGAAS